MALAIPRLELTPSRIICLHIPHGFHGEWHALQQELLQLARRAGKTTVFCKPATVRPGVREFFRKQRATEWLSRAAGISPEESARVIAEFGVPVAYILSANAGTPRCLLGIAASLIHRPAVLVYSCAGLDPSGCKAVHRF